MKSYISISCFFLCLLGGAWHAFAAVTQTAGSSAQAGYMLLSGSHAGLGKALRSNKSWLQSSAKENVRQLYSLFRSTSPDDINSKARGVTPHASALLGPMGINRFDLMQGIVFNNMAKKSSLASYEYDYSQTVFHPRLHAASAEGQEPIDYFRPLAESTNSVPTVSPSISNLVSSQWDAWLSPVTAFERYDAKSQVTENASATTLGISAGSVRHFKGYRIGFAGFFLRSASTGGGWNADVESYGAMAALENPSFDLVPSSPRVRAAAAYSYTKIKQDREDILGFRHTSFPEQHGIRLNASLGQSFPLLSWLKIIPLTGLDYTFIKQDAYTESGNGLRLAVQESSMHSIRPYIGGEINLTPFESLTLTVHGLVRSEVGDRTMTLASEIVSTPLSFSSQGHKYSRSSGNGGVNLTWQATEDVVVSAHYDILIGDRYPGHHAQTPAAMSFDGESYDGSSGNGGVSLNWRLADSVSFNATYDAVFDGDAPQTLMNAVLTWEF